jgi:SAM-dependent methyltransferase
MAHVLSQEKARLLGLLRVSPGDRVLDVGCGAGHDVIALAGHGAVPVGVDTSAHMLAESQRRAEEVGGVWLVRADGGVLPFAAASFDAARIERVLQHSVDPRAILAEAYRVLRPGGRLVVFEPDWSSIGIDSDSPDVTDAVIRGAMLGVRQPRIGLQLRALLVDAGYQDVECDPDIGNATSLDRLNWAFNIDRAIARATAAGFVSPAQGDQWHLEMDERSQRHRFWATFPRTIATGHA